jgi:hypothetical protein
MNARERSIERESGQKKTVYKPTNCENPQDLTDWEQVRGMTEEEIERNASSDADALPFDDDWEGAVVVYPRPR